MEELGSIWFYPESMDELSQKLQFTTFELEAVKIAAEEQLRKHEEEIKSIKRKQEEELKSIKRKHQEELNHLINLLNTAQKERDQLHRFITKNIPNDFPSALILTGKANSSITESNSLSHSHISSPVDSFFDAVSSPDFSNINALDNSTFVSQPLVRNCADRTARIDPADAVIEGLARGKALPQKGRLLQAVMEAGPLLQTLLVAGPLPRWKNPPPVQTFRVPPFGAGGPGPSSSSPYLDVSRGSNSPMCSASVLNFGIGHGSGVSNQIPVAKRQRFQ